MISIVVPVHNMRDRDFFLKRALDSIESQTFKDYEIVITEAGQMAENVNAGIKRAKGDIVKILAMDDYLAHPDSLKNIAEGFTGTWLVTGCSHIVDEDIELDYTAFKKGDIVNPHQAEWGDRMLEGYNTIGGMSVVAFANDNPPMYDEKLSWLIDVVFYQKLFDRYGLPVILEDINVIVGWGTHQMTHILSDEHKLWEEKYVRETYL